MNRETRVARLVEAHAKRVKTAGEVRFIKDRGGSKEEWGWGTPGPSEREINPNFEFNPKHLEPLSRTLRATLMALGHAQSAYSVFNRVKSAKISPDGNLGGKGYIQKIAEMRRQYTNVMEALSALSDTLYDEINAPHWDPKQTEVDPRERGEVQEIMEDVEEIRDDPEDWAEEEEGAMDKGQKKASTKTASLLVASRGLKGLVAKVRMVIEESAPLGARRRVRHFGQLYASNGGPVRDKRIEDLFYDYDATGLWDVGDLDSLEILQGQVNTMLLAQGVIGPRARQARSALDRVAAEHMMRRTR